MTKICHTLVRRTHIRPYARTHPRKSLHIHLRFIEITNHNGDKLTRNSTFSLEWKHKSFITFPSNG